MPTTVPVPTRTFVAPLAGNSSRSSADDSAATSRLAPPRDPRRTAAPRLDCLHSPSPYRSRFRIHTNLPSVHSLALRSTTALALNRHAVALGFQAIMIGCPQLAFSDPERSCEHCTHSAETSVRPSTRQPWRRMLPSLGCDCGLTTRSSGRRACGLTRGKGRPRSPSAADRERSTDSEQPS